MPSINDQSTDARESYAPTPPNPFNIEVKTITKVIPEERPGPMPAPQPAPSPKPIPVLPLVIVEEVVKKANCPLGKEYKARRSYPRTEGFEPKRRQSPCTEGGQPNITHEPRRRVLGSFRLAKLQNSYRPVGEARIAKKTREIAISKGYDLDSGAIKIFAEQRPPKGFMEKITFELTRGDACFYNVIAIESRRVCKCPDGSKCRSTVRKL